MSMSPMRARYGMTLVVFGISMLAILVADRWFGWLAVADITSNDVDVRGAVFGALIGLAGIFVAVLLGVLAIVTTLEERPIMQKARDASHYDELVHRLLGPVRTTFVLAIAAVICILIPGREPAEVAAGKASWAHTAMVAATLSLALALIFQTGAIATLIGKILLYRPDQPSTGDSPEAARRRVRARENLDKPAAEVVSLPDAKYEPA